jgi:hypothetical protein
MGPLEKLYGPLVTFGRRARAKGAEVAALAGSRIFLARLETILAVSNLLDHRCTPSPKLSLSQRALQN